MSEQIWAGRVFVRENQGGNHTGVVLDKCSDPAALAADLGFPDTGFVQLRSNRSATIRTFSPYEELAQCLQTTLATPVALGAEDGQTWLIRHPAGELTVQVERSGRSWLCWVLDTDTLVRTRVFTTSLGGHEDVATGGAAAGVGAILARDQRKGRIKIVQGPTNRASRGIYSCRWTMNDTSGVTFCRCLPELWKLLALMLSIAHQRCVNPLSPGNRTR